MQLKVAAAGFRRVYLEELAPRARDEKMGAVLCSVLV